MFVCLCNAISDTDLRRASENGAKDVESAYRFCGGEVQCGRCRETAEKILSEDQAGTTTEQTLKINDRWQTTAVHAAE